MWPSAVRAVARRRSKSDEGQEGHRLCPSQEGCGLHRGRWATVRLAWCARQVHKVLPCHLLPVLCKAGHCRQADARRTIKVVPCHLLPVLCKVVRCRLSCRVVRCLGARTGQHTQVPGLTAGARPMMSPHRGRAVLPARFCALALDRSLMDRLPMN